MDTVEMLPSIDPLASEYEKMQRSFAIQKSLGAWNMGKYENDWTAFLDASTDMAGILAPILGQYMGTQAILSADNETQVSALQAYLTGTTLRSSGRPSGMSNTTLSQLANYANQLPPDKREALMQAACADLLARTTDPAARAALQAQCARLSKPSFWDQYKVPIMIGTVTLGVVGVIFVAKRKEIFVDQGQVGVRA